KSAPQDLIWSGFPTKEQRKAVAELALTIAHSRRDQTGLHTPAQVGWAWSQLKSVRTLPGFLRWFARTFFSDDQAAGVDAAFQFLQACEFSFPKSLSAIQALVAQARPRASVNYLPYAAAMENWFRQPWMKQLDEAGIPLPLVERISAQLKQPETYKEALDRIRGTNWALVSGLSNVDLFILGRTTGVEQSS
ncbi:MAG: hypothetical protein ACTHLR_17710, partial [Rhizomicrobium sp.]